jgi:hypothetical protein
LIPAVIINLTRKRKGKGIGEGGIREEGLQREIFEREGFKGYV